MTTRYRLTSCGSRGGMLYLVDKTTGKRISLQTCDADEAQQILEARNQAERQPVLNLQIAKAYLAGTDNGIASIFLTAHWGCIFPGTPDLNEVSSFCVPELSGNRPIKALCLPTCRGRPLVTKISHPGGRPLATRLTAGKCFHNRSITTILL